MTSRSAASAPVGTAAWTKAAKAAEANKRPERKPPRSHISSALRFIAPVFDQRRPGSCWVDQNLALPHSQARPCHRLRNDGLRGGPAWRSSAVTRWPTRRLPLAPVPIATISSANSWSGAVPGGTARCWGIWGSEPPDICARHPDDPFIRRRHGVGHRPQPERFPNLSKKAARMIIPRSWR